MCVFWNGIFWLMVLFDFCFCGFDGFCWLFNVLFVSSLLVFSFSFDFCFRFCWLEIVFLFCCCCQSNNCQCIVAGWYKRIWSFWRTVYFIECVLFQVVDKIFGIILKFQIQNLKVFGSFCNFLIFFSACLLLFIVADINILLGFPHLLLVSFTTDNRPITTDNRPMFFTVIYVIQDLFANFLFCFWFCLFNFCDCNFCCGVLTIEWLEFWSIFSCSLHKFCGVTF